MNKEKFALGKQNFILIAVSAVIIIIGFILMSGGGSTPIHFDASIFSPLRIKVAPIITLVGFILVIFAIMYTPKDKSEKKD